MSVERDKISAKIRALLAKTVENGCTESEALFAARKAAELLEAYGLTLDEVSMREQGFTKAEHCYQDEVGERLWKVAQAIGQLTETTMWISKAGEKPRISFYGFEHDVMIASYILSICETAMRTEKRRQTAAAALFIRSKRQRVVNSFLDGMRDRLAERIREMIPVKPTGTGLVVLKKQLIDIEFEKIGIKLQDRQMRGSNEFDNYGDGYAAGDRVALNKGVGGPAQNRRRLT